MLGPILVFKIVLKNKMRTTAATTTTLITTTTATTTATTHAKVTTIKLDKVKQKEGECKNSNFQFAFDSLK